jgi:hypothetical protein
MSKLFNLLYSTASHYSSFRSAAVYRVIVMSPAAFTYRYLFRVVTN